MWKDKGGAGNQENGFPFVLIANKSTSNQHIKVTVSLYMLMQQLESWNKMPWRFVKQFCNQKVVIDTTLIISTKESRTSFRIYPNNVTFTLSQVVSWDTLLRILAGCRSYRYQHRVSISSINSLTRFNKIAIQNCKFQIASGQQCCI